MGSRGKSSTVVLILIFLILTSIVTFNPATVKAEPKTIVVPDDYPSIQNAIDNASAGDTVFVKAGVYNVTGDYGYGIEPNGITIDKPISLVGQGEEVTILNDMRHYDSKWPTTLVGLKADNVTVSGFKINSINLDGSNCRIENNAINFISAYGLNNLISENNISKGGIEAAFSDSEISGNNITGGGIGIDLYDCQNVTIKQNTISNIGKNESLTNYLEEPYRGGGVNLRYYGPYYIFENNITDNFGFGVQFAGGVDQSQVYNNNIANNLIGINLINYANSDNYTAANFTRYGSTVYSNNLVNNSINTRVEEAYPYKNVEYSGNRTDVVLWDNGKVGNYWSDYNGQGNYTIDENNVDHHPFIGQIDISETAPTESTVPLTIAIVTIIIVSVVVIVSLLLYRMHRKTSK